MKTIIVMPVANEGETMGQIIADILALPIEDLYLYPVIDSYSKDNTEQIIRKAEQETGRVKCIFYEESTGVISCYLEGFRQALKDGADYIIEMDGGGSHLPSELPQYIEALNAGYECVWGSRFIKGSGVSELPLYRRVLSGGGTVLANLTLGTKLKDMTSGFEGFRRDVLESMNFNNFLSRGHIYQTEMRYYCRNKKALEVPIHYKGGSSSLRFTSVTEALRVLMQLRENEVNIWKR